MGDTRMILRLLMHRRCLTKTAGHNFSDTLFISFEQGRCFASKEHKNSFFGACFWLYVCCFFCISSLAVEVFCFVLFAINGLLVKRYHQFI